jgi:polysaccharide deacetylase family protein (PEP-CTERM system associated)
MFSPAAAAPVVAAARASSGEVCRRDTGLHHFTVDVEEYFQVSALEPYVPRASWNGLESRVRESTGQILQLLAEKGAHGTFFVLGWIAKRYPELVREIAAGGHEVASHGWGHRQVTRLTPEQFRESVRFSRSELEDIAGAPVLGYRAPSFSIVEGREWALDILVEEGYRYDSSLFPVQRSGYGYASGGRDPYWLERPAGRLAEIPPATLTVAGKNLPAGGGAYFRLLPMALTRAALRSAERRGEPGTFYIHPWELDPGQPRFDVTRATRVRHYGRLGATLRRLRLLADEFRFTSVSRTLLPQ